VKHIVLFAACVAAIAGSFASEAKTAHNPTYSVTAHLALGGTGGWDYPSIDREHHHLFLSRSDHVEIVDLRTGKDVGTLDATNGVHGIAVAAPLNRGYASNGRGNSVSEFDLVTLKRLRDITITGQNPDAILFEPGTQHVFTFNGRSNDISVIDPVAGTQIGSITLQGNPEFAVADGKGHIFVNIESSGDLAEIDAKAMTVLQTWHLDNCEEPSGLAMDIEHARLFSVCGNQRMVVTDANDGRQVASVAIGDGPDGVAFDPARKLAFSANGQSGNLTIVHEDDPEHFSVVQTLATQTGARTITIDPDSHKLYLPTALFLPKAEGEKRAKMKPDSFTVLSIGS